MDVHTRITRRTRAVLALIAAAVVIASTAVPARAENKERAPFGLGVNLSGFSYYSSQLPFKDLMFQGAGLHVLTSGERPCPKKAIRDAAGWVISIPDGCFAKVRLPLHVRSDNWEGTPLIPYRRGKYVLLYDGAGSIEVGGDATKVVQKRRGRIEFEVPNPQNFISIKITENAPGTYVRNIRVLHSSDVSTYAKQPFNEVFLKRLAPFTTLRFMDWGKISNHVAVFNMKARSRTANTITLPQAASDNDGEYDDHVVLVAGERHLVTDYDGATRRLTLASRLDVTKVPEQPKVIIFDFANRHWSKRAKTGSLKQQTNAGVAFEYMIQLANITGKDPWICIPTAADDAFVESLAQLIKNKLDPSLTPHIEWSNESWNFGWPGYHWAEANGRAQGLYGAIFTADSYTAYRFVEVSRIFAKVYGVSPLRARRRNPPYKMLLSSQTAWVQRATRVMDWTTPGFPAAGRAAHEYADGFALTFYWKKPKGSKWVGNATMDELVELQIQDIDEQMADGPNPGFRRALIAELAKRKLPGIIYEGGTHLLPGENATAYTKLLELNRHPGMKRVYTHALESWKALADEYGSEIVGTWTQFTLAGKYSKYGYWGLLESILQDPATAPKYQAILDWSNRFAPPERPGGLTCDSSYCGGIDPKMLVIPGTAGSQR